MLIFLSGNDSYLAGHAIKQIKDKYLAKNDGAELVAIDETTSAPNWADLQAVPLFATTRLVIIRRLGLFPLSVQKILPRVLADVPSSTVVVVWDGRAVADQELLQALAGASKTIAVTTPVGKARTHWIAKRATELGLELSGEAVAALAAEPITDLWWLETELQSRLGGELSGGRAREQASEPFVFFNLVRKQDWSGVRQELARKVRQGEPMELTMGSLAAAVRKELRPSDEKRALTALLIDIDLGLKTGFLEGESAAAIIGAHLPTPRRNRVQWEQSWEEMAS